MRIGQGGACSHACLQVVDVALDGASVGGAASLLSLLRAVLQGRPVDHVIHVRDGQAGVAQQQPPAQSCQAQPSACLLDKLKAENKWDRLSARSVLSARDVQCCRGQCKASRHCQLGVCHCCGPRGLMWAGRQSGLPAHSQCSLLKALPCAITAILAILTERRHLARVKVDSMSEAPSRPGAAGPSQAAAAASSKGVESNGTSSTPAALSFSTPELIASVICSSTGNQLEHQHWWNAEMLQ